MTDKILVTGSNGFIGKNLIAELRNIGFKHIFEFDTDCEMTLLDKYCSECNFIFHLAGVNRTNSSDEYMNGNAGFTLHLIKTLNKSNNKPQIVFTSSIQAELTNDYGKSKKASEDLLFDYSAKNDVNVYIYRLTNLFGKWSRPNYNSVVATFCYNVSRNIPLNINNPNTLLNLCYIDDVIKEFVNKLNSNETSQNKFCEVLTTHTITVGDLAKKINFFKNTRHSLLLANMDNELEKKLYSTYSSYIPTNDFSYDLKMNTDSRGTFTEFIKSKEKGQISINVSKPGVVKGNHWHNSKIEKFLVVSGDALIRFRKINEDQIFEYRVNGDNLQVVDIPVGYTHSIVNVGDIDLVTVMWVNESFDPLKPDTYYLEV